MKKRVLLGVPPEKRWGRSDEPDLPRAIKDDITSPRKLQKYQTIGSSKFEKMFDRLLRGM